MKSVDSAVYYDEQYRYFDIDVYKKVYVYYCVCITVGILGNLPVRAGSYAEV